MFLVVYVYVKNTLHLYKIIIFKLLLIHVIYKLGVYYYLRLFKTTCLQKYITS